MLNPKAVRKVTERHFMRAPSEPLLAAKIETFRTTLNDAAFLQNIEFGRFCWIDVTGEYDDEAKETLHRAVRKLEFLKDLFAENGEIYYSSNIGEHPTWREIVFELHKLAKRSRVGYWFIATLHDDAQFGDFPLMVAKFIAKGGNLRIVDVRKNGIEQQQAKLNQQMEVLNRKFECLNRRAKQLKEENPPVIVEILDASIDVPVVQNRKFTLTETSSVMHEVIHDQ